MVGLMKIVHVIEGLDDSYGGPAKSVPYLAHHCRSHGVESILLSTRYADVDKNQIIAEKNLPWEVFDTVGPTKLRYSRGLLNRLLKICAADRGETIVHVHNLWNYTAYSAFKACRLYDVPLVISPRGSLFPWSLSQGTFRKKLAWNIFQKRALNTAVVHTTSKDEVRTVSALGVGRRVVCVRNGIELNSRGDQETSLTDAVTALHLDPKRRYALFMSRLHKKKGLELLFEAWADCPDRFDWTLLIAGEAADKKYLGALKSQVSALGLSESVQFVGFADADKKALLFAASHFFVLPSYTENFGIVVAEALSKGLPVITTVGTPWAELVSERAGWYINIDRQQLTSTLSEAMRLPSQELADMGENGRRLASKYDWNDIGVEMVDVYRQILTEAGSKE
jgi:glycosyltransferase involved in cell wall biosynthesis